MSKTSTKPKLVADPEVEPRATRRTFTAEYKARILAECDAVKQSGAIGAILRREGLFSSHLVDWRRTRDVGVLAALQPKKQGRPPKTQNPLASENERLVRENERLRDRLRKAEIILEAQKKLAEVLGSPFQDLEPTGRNA